MSSQAQRRTQRLGAYAVALRLGGGGEQILLARVSPTGFPTGWWGLPGGGVTHGEPPVEAMRRELHEETSLESLGERLVAVHDLHTVGPAREQKYEDYHGVHLLYAVRVDPEREPYVVETGGTTDRVEWVDIDRVADVGELLAVVPFVLDRLADYRQPPLGTRVTST